MESDEANQTSAWAWRHDGVGLLLAAMGSAICVRAYLLQLSLFQDEAFLLESVLPRGWGELTDPLVREQAAPVGFVYLLELSIALFGDDKLGFRAVPVAAAVASMFLFWVFIRQLVRGWPALVGMALFASGSWVTYYAQQTKQYTLELAVAIGLLCLMGGVARRGLTGPRLAMFAVAGVLSVWFAVTAVFIIAGCGIVLLVMAWRDGRKPMIAAVLGVGGLCVVSFFAQYALVLHHYVGSDYLKEYWSPFYLKVIPRLPFRIFGQLAGVFTRPVDLQLEQIGLVLSLIGLAAATRTRSALAWAVVVAWTVLILMSLAGRYPYGDRQVLFALPLLIGLLALGLRWLANQGPKLHAIAGVLAVMVLAGPVFTAGSVEADNDLEPVLRTMKTRIEPGDVVYVERGALYMYRFLSERWPEYDLSPAVVVPNTQPREHRLWVLDELEQFAGQPRVWLLTSHSSAHRGIDAGSHLVVIAEQLGVQLDRIQRGDTSATLFDFTARPVIERTPDRMPDQNPGFFGKPAD